MTNGYARVWPDVATHPGEHIQDFFDDGQIPIGTLAADSGLRIEDVQGLIAGETAVSTAIAEGLSKALGTRPNYWTKLQTDFELTSARILENKRFNMTPYRDFTKLTSGVSPIKDLVDSGDVPWRHNKVEQARYLCDWLGIPNLEGYENRILGHFQRSNNGFSPKPAPLVVWLRRGELSARQQIAKIPDYNESALKGSINGLRALTTEPPDVFLRAMRKACNDAGVAFVATPYVPGSGVRGVARRLDDVAPMIQINDQGNATDKAWFTFYHEVAHILHGDQDFLDLEESEGGQDESSVPDTERRANRFAENALIPDARWQEFANRISNGNRSSGWLNSARAFANGEGIQLSIVVGRLAKEGRVPDKLGWSAYNRLKQPFKLG